MPAWTWPSCRSRWQTSDREPAPVWDDALHLATLYDLIYTLPKPTIAAVNGAAVAGGAGLVTVCDLALAAPRRGSAIPRCAAAWWRPW